MIKIDLITVLIPTIIAIAGWFVVNRHAMNRDRLNKKMDLQVKYLIEAYRLIEKSANRPKEFNNDLELESAIADIQLFGTARQVQLAQQFALDIANKSMASTDELIKDLRKDLRNKLNLEFVKPELIHLRITKTVD